MVEQEVKSLTFGSKSSVHNTGLVLYFWSCGAWVPLFSTFLDILMWAGKRGWINYWSSVTPLSSSPFDVHLIIVGQTETTKSQCYDNRMWFFFVLFVSYGCAHSQSTTVSCVQFLPGETCYQLFWLAVLILLSMIYATFLCNSKSTLGFYLCDHRIVPSK